MVAGLSADGRPERGATKLNGNLVVLEPGATATGLRPGGFELVADPVRLRVQPDSSADAAGGRVEAEMVFEVGQALKVGYGGYLECGAGASAPTKAS